MNNPEAGLGRAAKRGDRVAIEQLFKEHYSSVYRYCRQLCRDAVEAEDLAQQAFLQAFRNLSRYRPERRMKPWILRIAHNLCISHLRRQRYHATLDDPAAQAAADPGISPERAALEQEIQGQLRTALAGLVPELLTVIVLRYQQQLSYDEIATVIGKPVTTVTSRLFEARQQLGRRLRVLEPDEGGKNALQLVGL